MEVTAERLGTGEACRLLDDLNDYDHIIVSESGGKDSVACLDKLETDGVDMSKVELWHQCIDDGEPFLDWPCSESYVQALGDLYGVPVFYQWRAGGFKGELLRKESITGDVFYYHGEGIVRLPSDTKAKPNTREKFPALSFDLSKRWCSASLKIDVGRRVIANEPRFQQEKGEPPKKILFITGERREESTARSKYNQAEFHKTHCKSRTVHHWRPVIDFAERDIWDRYEKKRLLPHPAYSLGWNRTSCFGCIFSTADLWAMMQEIAPDRFEQVARMERELGHTIDPSMSVIEKATKGSLDRLPAGARLSELVKMALDHSFRFTADKLIMPKWELPSGAFRGAIGGSL